MDRDERPKLVTPQDGRRTQDLCGTHPLSPFSLVGRVSELSLEIIYSPQDEKKKLQIPVY